MNRQEMDDALNSLDTGLAVDCSDRDPRGSIAKVQLEALRALREGKALTERTTGKFDPITVPCPDCKADMGVPCVDDAWPKHHSGRRARAALMDRRALARDWHAKSMEGWAYQGDGRCARGFEKCWHRGPWHAHEIGDADDPDDPGLEYVAHRADIDDIDNAPCFETVARACRWAAEQEESEALVAELSQQELELETKLKQCRDSLKQAELDARWRDDTTGRARLRAAMENAAGEKLAGEDDG